MKGYNKTTYMTAVISLSTAAMAMAEQATLQISDGTVVQGNDYAAGQIASGTSVELEGATVTISGGTYVNPGVDDSGKTIPVNRLGVLGGGNLLGAGSETTSLTYEGSVDMTMTGGNMASLWGGGILGGKGAFTVRGGISIDVTGGILDYAVMGGSMSGNDGGLSPGQKADGSTSTILGGTHVNVSGGAQVGTAPIGLDEMSANGLYAGSVYGGGIMANSSTESIDYTDVNVGGNAVVNGFVFGGGTSFANGSAEITGAAGRQYSVQVTIADNAVIAGGYVFGGMSSAYNQSTALSTITGDTLVTVEGGSIRGTDGKGYVFGGSYATGCWDAGQQAHSLITGSTHVRVSGGDNADTDIYGGGYAFQTNDSTSGGIVMTVTGNTNVTVSGGTVGNVYGGSLVEGAFDQVVSATVEGNANVTVSGGTVSGSVYGTGSGDAVGGNINVTLTGGAVKGGVYATAESSTVAGTKTLNFGNSSTGFNGSVDGAIGGFDKVYVYGGSTVTISCLEATDAARMQIIQGHQNDASATIEVSGARYNGMTGTFVTNAPFATGAVNVAYNTKATLSDSEFRNNTLTGESGAFLNGSAWSGNTANASQITLVNSEVSGNILKSTRTDGNSASGIQGGLINGKNVTIDNVAFLNNTTRSESEVDGVGLSNYSGILQAGNLVVGNSRFEGNVAESVSNAAGQYVYGGINSTRAGMTASFDKTLFDSNTAFGSYGVQGTVLHVFGGGIVNVTNSIFSNNAAEGTSYTARGTVAVYNGTLTAENTTFANNRVTSDGEAFGGAVYARKDDTVVNLTDVVFTGNAALKTGFGGAVMNKESSTVNFTVNRDALYAGNYATGEDGVADDARGGFLYTSSSSTTNIDVAGGATLTVGTGAAGYDSIASEDSSDTITKLGAGTFTVNSSMKHYTGSLNVSSGTMNVNNGLGASSISIGSGATLRVDIVGNNMLSNDSLSVNNAGTLILSAHAGLASGDYSLSAAGISSYGTVNAYGGTFDGNVFSVAAAQMVDCDTPFSPLTVETNGRVAVSNPGGDFVMMAFNNASGRQSVLHGVETLSASLAQVAGDGFKYVSAFGFSVDLVEGDSAVLSFLVDDAALTVNDFTIYHSQSGTGDDWTTADAVTGLTYDGKYLSFIVDGFSGYGFAAIPEPATCTMLLGSLAFALVGRRRKD